MASKQQVVIFGTGDFAQVAAIYLEADSPYTVAAFTIDDGYVSTPQLLGLPVIPFSQLGHQHPPSHYPMLVAIGFSKVNQARAEIYQRCKALGYQLISYVSSKAVQWGHVSIGDNCFIFEQNVLQPFVQIGNNVVLWSGNHIGHHAHIEDHCFIASHAVISGRVRIGPRCFVGVNATFRDGVTVAADCVIGAGALIVRDTQIGEVYRGPKSEPAPYKSHEMKNF
jgi:sugar O-acyltransferase (sialic acid O-acetyltransferase NeuD family)